MLNLKNKTNFFREKEKKTYSVEKKKKWKNEVLKVSQKTYHICQSNSTLWFDVLLRQLPFR